MATPAWIVYDEAGTALHQLALVLREHVPADFEVSLVSVPARRRRYSGVREGASALLHRVAGLGRRPSRLGARVRSRPRLDRLIRLARTAVIRAADPIEADGRARRRISLEGPVSDMVRCLRSSPAAVEPRADLSHAVTVFVFTVGAPSFEACLALLRGQDCTFAVRIVDHVAPLSAATQLMLDECATPYCVQLDEDMLLYPDAIRTLYGAIAGAPDRVAVAVGDLYDAHLDRCIQGVKIFRHAIAARYPFVEMLAYDARQVHRMRADGYELRPVGQTVGLHGTCWTPASIFARYATMERKRRAHPAWERWFDRHPRVFLERFLQDPTDLQLFALMGVAAGVYASRRGMRGEKDYRAGHASLGFDAVCRLLDAWRPASAPTSVRSRTRPGVGGFGEGDVLAHEVEKAHERDGQDLGGVEEQRVAEGGGGGHAEDRQRDRGGRVKDADVAGRRRDRDPERDEGQDRPRGDPG